VVLQKEDAAKMLLRVSQDTEALLSGYQTARKTLDAEVADLAQQMEFVRGCLMALDLRLRGIQDARPLTQKSVEAFGREKGQADGFTRRRERDMVD
jgi:hypothetical protein